MSINYLKSATAINFQAKAHAREDWKLSTNQNFISASNASEKVKDFVRKLTASFIIKADGIPSTTYTKSSYTVEDLKDFFW